MSDSDYPVDMKHCLTLQQIADTFEQQFHHAQDEATKAKNKLYRQVTAGQGTGDKILDMAVVHHALLSASEIQMVTQRYKDLEELCVSNQNGLFLVVKARLRLEDQDRITEGFYLGRVDGQCLFCPPEELGLCRFPVSKYVRAEFNTFCTDYEHGASVEPILISQPLTNRNFDLAYLDAVLTRVNESQVLRKLQPEGGELFETDGKPFKSLEIFVGVDAIMGWLSDIGPRRTGIYNRMFQLLDTPQK